MSHRRAQIESTLKRAIAQVLAKQISDPRIRGMVSITSISVSPDLAAADVHVSIVPEKYESRTLHGLNAASGRIGSCLRKAVSMRAIPRLTFLLDDTLKKQARIFKDIRDGLPEPADEDAEESEGPPAEPAPDPRS